jgi:hypothetical protein
MVKWKWSGLHANQERRRERERLQQFEFLSKEDVTSRVN